MSTTADRVRAFRKRFAARRSRAAAAEMRESSGNRAGSEIADPRAKSRRHGKVTADRWNQ
jgi:hypothetical protein